MKFFNLKHYIKLGFLLVSILLSSCVKNNAEELFDNSTTARKEKQIQELQNLLKSSTDGWKATYFTDDSILGGFSFIVKFKDDLNIDMISDFAGNYTVKESQYEINYGSTVKLVFSTDNFIHELSKGDNSPSIISGQGFKGDSEFLYYGTENDEIIFRSNKFLSEVRFKKATADDWINISKHQDVKDKLESSLFGKFILDGTSSNYNYNSTTRFLSTEDSKTEFGIGFTPTGIIISPSLEINGGNVNEFIFNASENKYVATLDGNEVASFVFFNTPQDVLPFYDYSNELDDFRLMRTRESIIPDDQSTPAFVEFFEQWRTDVSDGVAGDIVVSHVYLWNTDVEPYLQIRLTRLSDGQIFNARYYFTNVRTTDALGNIIETFTFDPTNPDNNDLTIPTLLQPFVDFFFSPGGFYIKDSIPYPLNSSQNTAIFISVDDPSMAMHWYDF